MTEPELDFLARNSGGPYKITLPSPVVTTNFLFRPGVAARHYQTREEMTNDAVDIVRAELKALSDYGSPTSSSTRDSRAWSRRSGAKP